MDPIWTILILRIVSRPSRGSMAAKVCISLLLIAGGCRDSATSNRMGTTPATGTPATVACPSRNDVTDATGDGVTTAQTWRTSAWATFDTTQMEIASATLATSAPAPITKSTRTETSSPTHGSEFGLLRSPIAMRLKRRKSQPDTTLTQKSNERPHILKHKDF